MVLGPISDHPYVGTGGVGTDAVVVFGVDHPYIYVGTGAVGTDAAVDADVDVVVVVAAVAAVLAAEEIGGAAIVAVTAVAIISPSLLAETNIISYKYYFILSYEILYLYTNIRNGNVTYVFVFSCLPSSFLLFLLGTHWGETRPRAKQKTFMKGTFGETLLACNSANSVPRTYPS